MCTVSFVNSNQKIIITSNRDEKTVRAAMEPQKYIINDTEVTFPKDSQSGGTWYAITDSKILVLLNGASEKHIPKPPYRRSRGLIVLDLICSENLLNYWDTIDLENIEPFTLVYFDGQLFQLRWNGIEKEGIELDASKNHIWSSSTLYSKEIRTERERWFREFVKDKSIISEEDLFHFHRYTKKENTINGLIINRNDDLKTLSITQSVVEKNQIKLLHHDLVNELSSLH
jgi:uncharacterized protein with NRDE domain